VTVSRSGGRRLLLGPPPLPLLLLLYFFSPFSWPSISLVAVHKEKSLRASRVCGGSDRAFIGGATLGFRVRMSRI
jgi:hypothetical protein